jgi:hypothetical protein
LAPITLAIKIDISFKPRDGYPRTVFHCRTSTDGKNWTEEETEIDYGLAERSDEELIVLGQRLIQIDLSGFGKLEWAMIEGLKHALREELDFRTERFNRPH